MPPFRPRENDGAAQAAIRQKHTEAASHQSETVLVVEDNDEVRAMAIATISDRGYRVLSLPKGHATLDPLHGDECVELLLNDLVMPDGMNGCELICKARVVRRDLKALVTSGYVIDVRKTGVPLDIPVLQRRYHRAELATGFVALGHN